MFTYLNNMLKVDFLVIHTYSIAFQDKNLCYKHNNKHPCIRYLLKSKIQRKDCFILAKPTYNYVSLDHKIFQILLWHNITFFLQKETFTLHSFLTQSHFTTNLVIMPVQWRPDLRVCPFNFLMFYAAPVLAECLTTLRS